MQYFTSQWLRFMIMMLNAIFNNVSVIWWWSVCLLLFEETGVPDENHWSAGSQWGTLLQNVVAITPRRGCYSNFTVKQIIDKTREQNHYIIWHILMQYWCCIIDYKYTSSIWSFLCTFMSVLAITGSQISLILWHSLCKVTSNQSFNQIKSDLTTSRIIGNVTSMTNTQIPCTKTKMYSLNHIVNVLIPLFIRDIWKMIAVHLCFASTCLNNSWINHSIIKCISVDVVCSLHSCIRKCWRFHYTNASLAL